MKLIVYLFSLFSILSYSQKKDCEYFFEEKTDSTAIKVLPEKLVYERVFGNSKDLVQFTLLNNNGVPTIGVQVLQKSSLFIPALCLDSKSKIIFQLENGKIVTLLSTNKEVCSSLGYDEIEKSNIRVLSGYFVFTRNNYEELKKSPISLMRIQFVGENKDYSLKKEINSEALNATHYPSTIFMEHLKCIE
jgi:hypothetical protein